MKPINLTLCFLGFAYTTPAFSQRIQSGSQPNNISIEQSNLFNNQSVTFFYGVGNDLVQQQIADGLKEQLKYDYPDLEDIDVQAPQIIGYQYHVRERISVGLIYCNSRVKTPSLEYPDIQNPNEVTKYHYDVSLNSFLGSFDYHWYIHRWRLSSLTLHSGFALGVNNINFNTVIEDGDGSNLPNYNFSQGGRGFQFNVIGIKHSFSLRYLKGIGYHANLGVGVNTIGFTTGIQYTL